MKPSSAKEKGRRACREAKELLHTYAPGLEGDDILVTSSGVTGEDLKFSPAARKVYPYAIEVKNVEKINVWECIAQAESHSKDRPGLTPLLIFKRNSSKLMVCLPLEEFLRLTRGSHGPGHNQPEVPDRLRGSHDSVCIEGAK